MNRFFNGRYGFDAYSIFLLLFSLMFLQTRYLWVVGVMLVGYAFFRMFSKDKTKRYIELQKFNAAYQQFINKANQILFRIRSTFFGIRRRFSERKEFVFLRCPKCKKTLRLPRKKGKLEVTCPVCRERFYKKT